MDFSLDNVEFKQSNVGTRRMFFFVTVSIMTILVLVSAMVVQNMHVVLEGTSTILSSTRTNVVLVAENIVPTNLRTKVLLNTFLDSNSVEFVFSGNNKQSSIYFSALKQCIKVRDYEKACSNVKNIQIDNQCLQNKLRKIPVFKTKTYTLQGDDKKIKINSSDIAPNTIKSTRELENKIKKVLTNVCTDLKLGQLKRQYKENIKVDFIKDLPSTDGRFAKRYAEIDYSRQLMFLWNKGKYETFKISGPSDYNYQIGIHKVYSKSRLAWSRPYRAWMPFWIGYSTDARTGWGVGIHALTFSCPGKAKTCAPNRRIYESVSVLGTPASDGCVRVSYKNAQYIYSILQVGDFVVVHK